MTNSTAWHGEIQPLRALLTFHLNSLEMVRGHVANDCPSAVDKVLAVSNYESETLPTAPEEIRKPKHLINFEKRVKIGNI